MKSDTLPKNIIVTGAGRGIGKAIALNLAKTGNQVICISKSDSCQSTEKEIRANGGSAVSLKIDLQDYERTYKVLSEWIVANRPERISVIAAAAIIGPKGPLIENSLMDWENTFKVNLFGNLAVIKATLPHMYKENYGRIIMFAGGGSAYAYPIFPAYAASKAATVRAAENLAEDFKDKNIAITCIAPGAIETDMLAAVKAAGGEIRSPGKMSNVLNFVDKFLRLNANEISGRFVHVLDDWQPILEGHETLPDKDHWRLRRIENKRQ